MWIGQRIHSEWQRHQSATDPTFQSEVSVEHRLVIRGWEVRINGRVDGLREHEHRHLVEEIKSTTLPGERLACCCADDFPEYVRQVQLYMHFLRTSGKETVGRLVLISVLDGTQHLIDVPPDPHIVDFLHRHLDWIIVRREERVAWLNRRRAAVTLGLPFAHDEWRFGQRDLADEIEESLHRGNTLLLTAPTGYGKTAAALYAALTVAYRTGRRVFFATARTTQQRMAEEVVSAMALAGLPVRAVSLRAREKVCLNEVVACRPDCCEYAVDYHDRIADGDVIRRIWSESIGGCVKGVPRPDGVVEFATQARVCPFALSLELSAQADVIIGDYNYVFDPSTRLSELEQDLSEWLVIVDEAHNLPQRAMAMGSPRLSLAVAEQAMSVVQGQTGGEPFAKLMRDVSEFILAGVNEVSVDARDGEGAFSVEDGIDAMTLVSLANRIESMAVAYAIFKLKTRAPSSNEDGWLDVSRAVLRLRAAVERAGPETVVLWRRGPSDRRGRLQSTNRQCSLIGETPRRDPATGMALLCRDPSGMLGGIFDRLGGAVCMSATLRPSDFYQAMFGLPEDKTKKASFSSPFPPENRQVVLSTGVSTAFRDRDRDREQTGKLVSEAVSAIPGNVAVYFSSFAFRDATLPSIDLSDRPVLLQQRHMSEQERDAFLTCMARGEGHVLMAVLGGIFSEGIDLPGAGLAGVIVVGPALPQANLSRRLMQSWYQEQYGHGFRYAWLVPGMARVVQAAGRVIRTPQDRGTIVLVGRRFLQRDYQDFFPEEWDPERTKQPGELVRGFWSKVR